MRSYHQYCAVARALDVVGDRWSLLIVRELLIRPCRYTDLRDGLPGIATNLLAERLRELEAAGVVRRDEAAPPVATTLYRLTERGEQLRPVIEQLLQWGAPLMFEPAGDDQWRSRWLLLAIETMLAPHVPGRPDVVIQIDGLDEPVVIESRDGRIEARTGTAPDPDTVMNGPADAVLGMVMGFVQPDSPEARTVTVRGSRQALARLRG